MAEPGFVPPDPRSGCCNRPVVVPAAGPADLPAVSATERCTRPPGHEPPCGELVAACMEGTSRWCEECDMERRSHISAALNQMADDLADEEARRG